MPSKSLENHRKAQVERLQAILHDLLMEEENKYCADCDAKQPRWASWNLGVFLCIRCAGIHRSIGVQVSKVKSVNLDSWTPEQVQSMRVMGNAKAKAVYEAELPRDYRRPQTEQQLEVFIRAKYEHKRYMLRDWEPPKVDVADLIPALEKGQQHRGSIKKLSNLKKHDNSLPPPNLSSPKSSSPSQQAKPAATITDMQLLDFSDSTPTSSSTPNKKTVDSTGLDFFDNDSGAGDVAVGVDVLRLSDKADGADEELEDMFGPIVSAPRIESQSEPPVDVNPLKSNKTSNDTIQQSVSATNLGDLSALSDVNSNNSKKSNADILALFGSEPLVRPMLQTQMMPQFPQGVPYDSLQASMSVPRPQFRCPMSASFSTNAIPYLPGRAVSQPQQQFPYAANAVNGMMGNFMSKETFAVFAAASPFATSNGPLTNLSPNLIGGSSDLLNSVATSSAVIPPSLPSFSTDILNVPVTSSAALSMPNSSTTNGMSGSIITVPTDHWPSSHNESRSQKITSQPKVLLNDSAVKKDPLVSLDNCFADFEHFGSSHSNNSSRVETATAQDLSLWD